MVVAGYIGIVVVAAVLVVTKAYVKVSPVKSDTVLETSDYNEACKTEEKLIGQGKEAFVWEI